jgi:hypothetical protein
VTVSNRNWHSNPASPVSANFQTWTSPPQPTDNPLLGVSNWSIGDNGFSATTISNGPNTGYLFYANPLSPNNYFYQYSIDPDISNTNSSFYLHQCGQNGVILGSDLLAQTLRHEYNSQTESHWAFYSESLNDNNPGDLFEFQVGTPGSNQTTFQNATRNAVDQVYANIRAEMATKGPTMNGEPFAVNQSETGQFLGTINFPNAANVYSTCN